MLTRLLHRRGSVARANGVDLHWVEAGEGRPLVLLHGVGDSHLTWSKVVPALARTRRVLVPDLCGHGLSGRPNATYTLDWHARTITEWLEQLAIEEADVVGHSYGGGVAQWMLLNPAHRVRRLALVSSGGLGREVSLALRLAATPYVMEHMGQPFMATGTFVALQVAIRGVYSSRELLKLALQNGKRGTARAFARTVRDVIDLGGQRRGFHQHAHALRELPPIGVFWGANDPIIPVSHAAEAARVIPGVTITTFARCGHYPHRERPGTFVDALEAFLDRDATPVLSPWFGTGIIDRLTA
ncbi:MAG: alpha/beta fold hydrolase [Labilithrix sp.]|nr:alpha/beta fold hydrolase [Labilithrix sp.]MCW5810192.1 alpha/beta fold hydrolase [Labilithrix sp.]